MVYLLIAAAILVVAVALLALSLCRAAKEGDAAIRDALRESARAHQRGER